MNPEAPAPIQQNVPQPPAPAGAPAAQQPLTVQRANSMAVAALVLGILGFLWILPIIGSILGIIFGIIALSQIKQGKGTGKGMAHTGLWLGVASLVISTVVIALIISALPKVKTSAEDVLAKARAAEISSSADVFRAENGYYPASLADMTGLSSNTLDTYNFEYTPNPVGCFGSVLTTATSSTSQKCTSYTVMVKLSDGTPYVLTSGTTTLPTNTLTN